MSTAAVIVVTSDHAFCIKKCLESVLESERPFVPEIIVVDNDSVDETPTIISQFGSSVRLMQRQGRHSLSNNLNNALATVRADYVLIINPDVVLAPGTARVLSGFLDSHPTAGACAPSLVFPDGRLQLSCRRFPTPWSFVLRRTPVRLLLPYAQRGRSHLMADSDHAHMQAVDWVLGGCTMFRHAALLSIGLFDEDFRLYCEDIDICYRLWANGWSVHYNPAIRVIHEHRARSDKRLLSQHSWWHYRSMIHYFLKHGINGFSRPCYRKRPPSSGEAVCDAVGQGRRDRRGWHR
jgi:hypothetical protein